MQKKLFSIEWPDEYGANWMNPEFIECCMKSETCAHSDTPMKIIDVTLPPPEPQPALGGHDL